MPFTKAHMNSKYVVLAKAPGNQLNFNHIQAAAATTIMVQETVSFSHFCAQ